MNINAGFAVLRQRYTCTMKEREQNIPICCDYEMERIFNSVPVQFKGTGFHKTDYPSTKEKVNGFVNGEVHKNTTPEDRKSIMKDD